MGTARYARVDRNEVRLPDEDSERRLSECQQLAARVPERIVRNDGDFDTAFAAAPHRLEAVYELPLLAHAPMEPMNCAADVRQTRCDVWAPTQNPAAARAAAARISGLTQDVVTVHVTRSGGGFGRRFYSDFVAEAVLLSKAARAPVQVVWTREDDVRHDYYRPAAFNSQSDFCRDRHSCASSSHPAQRSGERRASRVR